MRNLYSVEDYVLLKALFERIMYISDL